MKTGLFSHPACLAHIPPAGHPESPDRLRAVLAALEKSDFSDLARVEAPRADRDALKDMLIHTIASAKKVIRDSKEETLCGFGVDFFEV